MNIFLKYCSLVFYCILFSFSGKSQSSHKNITYSAEHKLKLNVFSPKKSDTLRNVFVFIHGGNWNRGKKSTYNFLGRRMAEKNVITVIIDYRKYPTRYDEITRDVAQSIKWVKENIATYGGDTNKIFVSGHSAGGHLAALVATDNQYFEELNMKNPVKGVVLIDAFGMDMHKYLSKNDKFKRDIHLGVFTKDTSEWKKASPAYNLHRDIPKFMVYVGEKTYPNIIDDNNHFLHLLKRFQPNAEIIQVKGANHLEMIFGFYNSRNKAYCQIIEFMNKEPLLIY